MMIVIATNDGCTTATTFGMIETNMTRPRCSGVSPRPPAADADLGFQQVTAFGEKTGPPHHLAVHPRNRRSASAARARRYDSPCGRIRVVGLERVLVMELPVPLQVVDDEPLRRDELFHRIGREFAIELDEAGANGWASPSKLMKTRPWKISERSSGRRICFRTR